MGIEAIQWRQMLKHFPRPAKVLSLGYPDMLVPAEEVLPHVPDAIEVSNADEVRKWHGWDGPVWDTLYVFRKLGWDLDCVDFKRHRGCERIVDLNYILYLSWDPDRHTYDALIDPGSLEHVFNIGNAWHWALGQVKPGGILVHFSPATVVNHGMYCISPGTYPDLYGEENILEQFIVAGDKHNRIVEPFKQHARGRVKLPPEVWNFVVAKNPPTFEFPIQKKYR
jgi:hypothetical protein